MTLSLLFDPDYRAGAAEVFKDCPLPTPGVFEILDGAAAGDPQIVYGLHGIGRELMKDGNPEQKIYGAWLMRVASYSPEKAAGALAAAWLTMWHVGVRWLVLRFVAWMARARKANGE